MALMNAKQAHETVSKDKHSVNIDTITNIITAAVKNKQYFVTFPGWPDEKAFKKLKSLGYDVDYFEQSDDDDILCGLVTTIDWEEPE